MFVYQNIKYSLIKIDKLLLTHKNSKYISNIDRNKYNKLNNLMFINCQPITPIYFANIKDQIYILNGKHRFEIYKLNKNLYSNLLIPIVDIYLSDINQLNKYNNIINYPINQFFISTLDNNIIEDTYKYFISNFQNSFKYNGNRRPFLNKDKFKIQLEYIYNYNNNNGIDNDIISQILNLNNKYKNQKIEWFPAKGFTNNNNLLKYISNNNCLYLGMIPDWHLHLYKFPKFNSENKISQSLRQQVWMKYANNNLEMKCICCNHNIINSFTFECGHIVPVSKGGLCNIFNLVPICSLCNKSMGNINMKTFMLTNNYNISKLK